MARPFTNPVYNSIAKLAEAAADHADVLCNLTNITERTISNDVLSDIKKSIRDSQKKLTRRMMNVSSTLWKVRIADPVRACLLCGDADGILSALRAEVLEACDAARAEDPALLFPLLGAVWPHWLRQHLCDPATLPKKLADVATAEALKGYRLRPEWEWCAAPVLSEISALISAQAVKAQALVNITRARGENTAAAEAAALAAAEAFTRAEARAEAAHAELDTRAGISSAPAPVKVLPRQRRALPRFMRASALAARS